MLGDQSQPILGRNERKLHGDIPAAISDIGCEREINEDRYAVIEAPNGRAWIVCDGMGGVAGGDLAAQLAIDAIRRALGRGYNSALDALSNSIQEANRIVVLRRQNPAFSSMGTTVVAAIIDGNKLFLANAGDSRAYLVRNGSIEQLTVDHTYVQDLVDRGAINMEEALSHPQAHVLTRCIGAEPRLRLDTNEFWVWDTNGAEAQDRLVLCTDGLYSLVNDQEIADLVSRLSPQESCVELVELAKSRGGFDNITVAVIPLDGQLREENPGVDVKKKVSTASASTIYYKPNYVPKQRQLITILLMGVLGATFGAVLFLLKLMFGS